MADQLHQLKELKIRTQGESEAQMQVIIDRAILDAEREIAASTLEKYMTKSNNRDERLSIAKEIVPILIATSSPRDRNPKKIIADAVDYADALIRELDK